VFFKCEDSSTIKQRFNQTPEKKKKNKRGCVLQKQDDVMSDGDSRNGILKEKISPYGNYVRKIHKMKLWAA